MDGTLGSQTAWMLDGSGVVITSGERARRDHPRGRAARLAGRRPRDRRPREPRGARRLRVDARRVGAARTAAPDRARTVPRAGGRRHASRSSASPARCSSATRLGSRPRRALLARAGRRRLRLPLAAGVGRARRERLGRAGRGARPARRHPRRRPAHDRRAARHGIPSSASPSRRRSSRRCVSPAWLSRRRAAARQAPPRLPRRPRRALARPARVPAGRARVGRGRRDDGRRPLGAQPARPGTDAAGRHRREPRAGGSSAPTRRRTTARGRATRSASTRSSRALRAPGRARGCSRSAPAPARRRGVSSTSARDPLVAIEPNDDLARLPGARASATAWTSASTSLEDAELRRATSISLQRRPRSTGSTSPSGSQRSARALRPGGWIALWWTLFGDGERRTRSSVRRARSSRASTRARPSRRAGGRRFARDAEARHRRARRGRASRTSVHEVVRGTHTWDTEGIRALYGTFSPILGSSPSSGGDPRRRSRASRTQQFGGRVRRTLVTALYTARKPA